MRFRTLWPYGTFAGLLVVGLVVFTYKDRANEDCPQCYSHRVTEQWRFGLWMGPSLPLGPAIPTVRPSHLVSDFPDPQHLHQWSFSQSSPYYLLGTVWGGCALGHAPEMNALASAYENDPGFRDFIQTRIHEGLDRRKLFAACVLQVVDYQSPRSPALQVLLDLESTLLADYHRANATRR
jgi:hypothetical protein